MEAQPRRKRSGLRVIGTILLASAVTYWAVELAPLPFSASQWKARSWNDSMHVRHRMADWIVLFGSFGGEPRAKVVSVLGEPPPTAYFKEWDMVYNLGVERGLMAIDSEWLVFQLDGTGRVREAQIVRD